MTLTKPLIQLIVKVQISSIISLILLGYRKSTQKGRTRTTNIDIKGYTFEHTPTEASCAGSLPYIKDTLKHICRKDLQIYKSAELESTFIELLSSSGKI